MRKLFILLLIIGLVSVEAIAQMQQGTWMVEGSAGLTRSRIIFPDIEEKSSPSSGYTLHPKAGFFLSDNLAVGISGLFGSSWSKNKDYDSNIPGDFKRGTMLSYGGGVFLRKYAQISESLSFFAEVGSEFSWRKQKDYYNEPIGKRADLRRRTFSAQTILGLQYLISPKLGVHLQTNLIQYQNAQLPPDSGNSRSEFRAGFLIDPRFGLTIFL